MCAIHSKSAYLHGQIGQALRSGRYLPGQRIDPMALAAEFATSPTPVRYALARLAGEGRVADHARNGLLVPLPTEIALRDQYDWQERLLSMALEAGVPPAADTVDRGRSADGQEALETWRLFDAIARATSLRPLQDALRQANDRLAPIRWAKQALVVDASPTPAELAGHWQRRDLPALRAGLQRYHALRRHLVPQIIALLVDRRDRLS
ncbi:GntR family transcriptional regulator [Stenotrophomonas mori]|uniref:GntR family transcriptional regulator n=1 Tax=Stenotrophomonas mori TaxID=2871096 RepID=A0ABT0SI29_9GAMM|nr:GntR family transcriptional regulator [Stenotrophomonas mori]MCL7714977.1 GntR family transcriptional regulator [Stenotrophomonas mori]